MCDLEILSFLCNVFTFLIAILAFRKYTEVRIISDLNKHMCWIKKTIVDRDGTSWWSRSGEGKSRTKEGIDKILNSYIKTIADDENKLIELYSDIVFRFNDGNEIQSVIDIIFFLRNVKAELCDVRDKNYYKYNNGEFTFEPMISVDKKRKFNRIYDAYRKDMNYIQYNLHWKNSFNQS